MKVIDQSHEITELPKGLLKRIERAGRTCYKSEDKITDTSAYNFAKKLIERGHEAMIEFGDIEVKFITNRGVSHELVRHRLFSFAQESTRYVRYDRNMEFIRSVWINKVCTDSVSKWAAACAQSELNYLKLLKYGWRPEQARDVLNHAIKTEVMVKGNLREWRHAIKLRTSKHAHPQIRELFRGLHQELKKKLPVIFDDITY